jgi:Ni/Fe-hydrogenase subunit HybB-like protein
MAISEGDRVQAECMSLYDLTDSILTIYIYILTIRFGKYFFLELILEWKNKFFSTKNMTLNIKVIPAISIYLCTLKQSSFSVLSSALESYRDW